MAEDLTPEGEGSMTNSVQYPNIVLCGRAGAGKSTLADVLVREFGYTKLSFAAPLKVGVGSSSNRELLQGVGVGVRILCPDFWVNLLLDAKKHAETFIDAPRFVVDDCRFPNELRALHVEGFVSVRIRRGRNQRLAALQAINKIGDESQLDHSSETALDNDMADYNITNAGTLEDLRSDLVQILDRVQR